MSQRLEITKSGEILVHTDNGMFNGSVWDGEIRGDFAIDAVSVGRLLASNVEGTIKVTATEKNSWYKWYSPTLISKEDLLPFYEKAIKEKDECNEQLSDSIERLKCKVNVFNALPFWKKVFYKFNV